SVTGIVTSMNANRQDFYQRMDQLNHFVSEQRFPETLKMRLRDYFRFKNRYNNFCNHQGLLQYMSPMLRREVAVHTHMPWIRALEFFSDCCDDFVIEVAMSLTYLTYPANELVISFAEEAEAMYIINKGVVCTQGIILTAKMVFGTDMLWSNARRFYAARSLTFLNVFVLHRVNLMRILENEKFVSEKHKLYKVSVRAQFREEVLVLQIPPSRNGGGAEATTSQREGGGAEAVTSPQRLRRFREHIQKDEPPLVLQLTVPLAVFPQQPDAEDTAAVAKSLLGDRRRQAEEKKKTEERVAAAVSTAEKMTDDEIWEAEEHAEDSWVNGVTQSEGDLVDLQRELAQQPSVAASTVEVGGLRGYTVFVDDFSGRGHIYFWKRKLEYLQALEEYRDIVRTTGRAILGEDLDVEEIVYDLDLLVLQSDNDWTIIAGQTAEYCKQHNIIQRAEWEGAIVCANARKEHRLPYQVLLLRHCGRMGKSVDIAGTSIRFQASDKKEECALIDVKGAIVPVPNLPAGVKALGMKAIYKPKVDTANVLTERKSRWVVFGNKQSHGVNYEEVYSPCTQLNTLRILLQLSLILGLWAFTMDVVTCFLNGELDVANPLYVRWPDGRMYDALLAVSNVDPCLFYIFRPDELIVFIYIHVDNFLVLTSSEAWKNTFFASFNSAYPSVDEGALTDILGMRMTFRDAGLVRECRMSQHGLIHRMLEKYGMTDCNPALSPMEPKLALTPADPQDVATAFPYANLAMELMWLGRCTRPDILPAVCYLARFMHCHSATHWQHLLRVLRYLKGTIDVCLTLQCSSPASHNAELVVAAYSDADHAADKVTRRSVTGSLVRLNGSTVMYSSKLQKTVAVSTADAELVALSETAWDIEHVVNLLSEFSPVKLPVVLHGDNHASIIQAGSALNNTASRHIAVRDRYVAKLAELGRIRIVKVPSVENLADFFTKFMPTDRFLVLRQIVLRFFRSTEE
ncbi:hypothetical protein CYMTET_35474, partial [Cymbomonas tetramitiformis]